MRWTWCLYLLSVVSSAHLLNDSSWCNFNNCECVKDVNNDNKEADCRYKLGDETRLKLIWSLTRLNIECHHNNVTAMVWNSLAGLHVGPVPEVHISFCALPQQSFHPILTSIGLDKITSFHYRLDNISQTISADAFLNMSDLLTLELTNNKFTILPDGLLKDLPNLNKLDLSGNKLTLLPADLLSYSPNLTVLYLSGNAIETIEPLYFSGLSKLKTLHLLGNRLKLLKGEIFAGLLSLEELELTANRFLEHLSGDIFANLTKLKKLNLSVNNFTSFEVGLLQMAENLETVRLDRNAQNLSLPNGFFGNLKKLEDLSVVKSGVKILPKDLLRGSPAILKMSMKGNLIETLPAEFFEDQKNLQRLTMSENMIREFPDYVFKNLKMLNYLDLSNNYLTDISKYTFHGLNNLEYLNLNYNYIKSVSIHAFQFMSILREASLTHNQLNLEESTKGAFQRRDVYGNRSPFHSNCKKLEILNLANNSIKEMFQDWRFNCERLKTLNLSYNAFDNLQGADLQFLQSRNVVVDLTHNKIDSIWNLSDLGAGSSPLPPGAAVPKVLVSHNPLSCDCSAYNLGLYVDGKLEQHVYDSVYIVSKELRCAGPPSLQNELFSQVPLLKLTCDLLKEDGCPPLCNCSIGLHNKAVTVDCSGRHLKQAPEMSSKLMSYGSNQTILILEKNNLTTFPDMSLPGYQNVSKLFLSHNNIADMNSAILGERLQELHVDNNNLRVLNTTALERLKIATLNKISLHSNPWLCNCENRDLLSWLFENQAKLPLENLTCSDGRMLNRLLPEELCPASLLVSVLCSVLAVVGVLAGATAALYFRHQHSIKVWMYAHHFCLWFVTEKELDKDKRYDAFVSFSQKDQDFVVKELVPRLEANGLSLCLHYRDWVAGEWIPAQIARSVEDSRRTLIVLSPNFLQSVWGAMEFRAAHKQALSEGRARVVMLLYGDLPHADQLDPELRAYISMNTYVQWGDTWFWDKLLYALPHAFRPHRKRTETERMELMNPNLSPANTPSTPPANALPLILPLSNNKCASPTAVIC